MAESTSARRHLWLLLVVLRVRASFRPRRKRWPMAVYSPVSGRSTPTIHVLPALGKGWLGSKGFWGAVRVRSFVQRCGGRTSSRPELMAFAEEAVVVNSNKAEAKAMKVFVVLVINFISNRHCLIVLV